MLTLITALELQAFGKSENTVPDSKYFVRTLKGVLDVSDIFCATVRDGRRVFYSERRCHNILDLAPQCASDFENVIMR